MSSSEGFQYIPGKGLVAGLPTRAALTPSRMGASTSTIYDTIVVGAGFAGLAAARDLAVSGKKVLMLEGRDRIGGRTWSSEIDGDVWELGGTYFHWGQPHTWSEISRYGLGDQLKDCFEGHPASQNPTLKLDGELRSLSPEEQSNILSKASCTFFDVDGQGGKTVIPYPMNSRHNTSQFLKWDKLSVQDRFDQLEGQWSREEFATMSCHLTCMAGGPPSNVSFLDCLRWFALGHFDPAVYGDYMGRYKLKTGMTTLATAIFDEALMTGRFAYQLSAKVASVDDTKPFIAKVSTADNQTFQARKVVCTVPLMALKSVQFSPPLPTLKADAIAEGHINRMYKALAEVEGKKWRNWSGNDFPHQGISNVAGDSFTSTGNVIAFAFGWSGYVEPCQEPEKFIEAMKHVHSDLQVKRLVFTDWTDNQFSQGGWCHFAPGFATKYLEALQSQVGNIMFANADWADGWRSFIDGAIEQGLKAARDVNKQLFISIQPSL